MLSIVERRERGGGRSCEGDGEKQSESKKVHFTRALTLPFLGILHTLNPVHLWIKKTMLPLSSNAMSGTQFLSKSKFLLTRNSIRYYSCSSGCSEGKEQWIGLHSLHHCLLPPSTFKEGVPVGLLHLVFLVEPGTHMTSEAFLLFWEGFGK